MSWMNLFKTKSVKLEADPTVRWFGKLPTYADYYAAPADADWAVEFQDWLLKGFEQFHTKHRQRGGPPRLPNTLLLLRLPKSQMTVLASLQDYGGDMRGRPFPLCFYAALPSQLLPGPTADQAGAVLRELEYLANLRHHIVRFFNAPGRFEDTFGGRELRFDGLPDARDDAWRKAAQQITLEQWFAAAHPTWPQIDNEDPSASDATQTPTGEQPATTDAKPAAAQPSLTQMLAGAQRWAGIIRQHAGPDFAATLRFPLAARLSRPAQIAGWLHWIEQSWPLADQPVSWFIPEDPDAMLSHFTISTREPTVEDFLLLTPAAGELRHADTIGPISTDDPQGSPPDQASPTDAMTWATFVGLPKTPAGAAAQAPLNDPPAARPVEDASKPDASA